MWQEGKTWYWLLQPGASSPTLSLFVEVTPHNQQTPVILRFSNKSGNPPVLHGVWNLFESPVSTTALLNGSFQTVCQSITSLTDCLWLSALLWDFPELLFATTRSWVSSLHERLIDRNLFCCCWVKWRKTYLLAGTKQDDQAEFSARQTCRAWPASLEFHVFLASWSQLGTLYNLLSVKTQNLAQNITDGSLPTELQLVTD